MAERTSQGWENEANEEITEQINSDRSHESDVRSLMRAQVYATLSVAAAIREQTHVHTQAIIELLKEAPTDAR